MARVLLDTKNATNLNISVSRGNAATYLGVVDNVTNLFLGNLTGFLPVRKMKIN